MACWLGGLVRQPDALAPPIADVRLGMVGFQGRQTLLQGVLVPGPHRKLTWLLRALLSALSAGRVGVLHQIRQLR